MKSDEKINHKLERRLQRGYKKRIMLGTVEDTAAMLLVSLRHRYPEKSEPELFTAFYGSKTCEKLYDFNTGLWREGSDYILNLFLEEVKHEGF